MKFDCDTESCLELSMANKLRCRSRVYDELNITCKSDHCPIACDVITCIKSVKSFK